MVNLFADMGIQPANAAIRARRRDRLRRTLPPRPPSSIRSARLPRGQVVTISGTASDVGGVIAGVEVSTDNGASWHPAIGDETWTYTWSPQVAGTYTISSRAVDDSINLETPSAGRTVTVTGPAYLTLFPGSATPAIVNATDSSAVELGVKFQTVGVWHRQRYPVLQEQPGYRHPHRRAVVEHRNAVGNRHLHQRDHKRLADRDLLQPGDADAGRDLHRLLSHECRPLLHHQ